MFTNLEIEFFRGIKGLQISDLSKINLIVGTNGSGKSTILDSLFLMTNPLNAKLIVNANLFRGYKIEEKNFFTSLFYGLTGNHTISFSSVLKDGSKRDLLISPNYNSDDSIDYQDEMEFQDLASALHQETTSRKDFIPGVLIDYKMSKYSNTFRSKVGLIDGELKVDQPKDLKEEFKGVYLSNNIYPNSSGRLDNVIVNKELGYIVDKLKIIEESIDDLRLTQNGMIYCDLGHSRLLPVSVMGDGFQKLLNILLAIYDAKNGVLFIDEIENGIYYSKFPAIWKAIFKACNDFNVQLFATTHSIECIESFSKFSMDSELFDSTDNLNLYRVEQKTEKHKVTLYDRAELRNSLAHGFEIR